MLIKSGLTFITVRDRGAFETQPVHLYSLLYPSPLPNLLRYSRLLQGSPGCIIALHVSVLSREVSRALIASGHKVTTP